MNRLYLPKSQFYSKALVLLAIGLVGGMLTSCRADIDLGNIDTTAQANMGLAMPIGTFSTTIGDFLGNGQIDNLYADPNNHNIITFTDTFHISNQFHQVDLSQYITTTEVSMGVYDQMRGIHYAAPANARTNASIPVSLTYPLSIDLEGINSDLTFERLDSALIENAHFVSTITPENLPIEWEWIRSIRIDLGEAFYRPAGQTITIYDRNAPQSAGIGYGSPIDIVIDQFSLCLMKDKNPSNWAQYLDNVTSTIDLTVHFDLDIPLSNGSIDIPENAAFRYNLGIQLIDYSAFWGMVAPSKDMKKEDVVEIVDVWDSWAQLSNAWLPFADPYIEVGVTTQIAGALKIQDAYLFVESADGSQHVDATFDGRKTYNRTFEKGEYVPLDSEIGDSATMRVRFSKDPERGCIDRLFAIRPDRLGYGFNVDFDKQSTPQIRLTPDTKIGLEAIASFPFTFNKGVRISYRDTMENLDFSTLMLDSLLDENSLVDSLKAGDIKLYIQAENTIPLRIKAILRALDEQGQVVMDPNNPDKPYLLTSSDTIVIEAGTLDVENDVIVPGITKDIISIQANDFDTFSQIKAITYEMILDDAQQPHIEVKSHSKLRLQLGLAANVDAILDFGGNQDNNQ